MKFLIIIIIKKAINKWSQVQSILHASSQWVLLNVVTSTLYITLRQHCYYQSLREEFSMGKWYHHQAGDGNQTGNKSKEIYNNIGYHPTVVV